MGKCDVSTQPTAPRHRSSVIGSQFRPSAVDWGGKTVRMRVMLSDVADASAWLASFAHEPVVRVGAYAE